MIDTLNDVPSDLKLTPESLMIGCKNNKAKKSFLLGVLLNWEMVTQVHTSLRIVTRVHNNTIEKYD